MREYHKRSLVRAVCWRVLATISTMAIVYVFTGEALLCVGIGAVEIVVKLLLYYGHERVWNLIAWGKLQHPLAHLAASWSPSTWRKSEAGWRTWATSELQARGARAGYTCTLSGPFSAYPNTMETINHGQIQCSRHPKNRSDAPG